MRPSVRVTLRHQMRPHTHTHTHTQAVISPLSDPAPAPVPALNVRWEYLGLTFDGTQFHWIELYWTKFHWTKACWPPGHHVSSQHGNRIARQWGHCSGHSIDLIAGEERNEEGLCCLSVPEPWRAPCPAILPPSPCNATRWLLESCCEVALLFTASHPFLSLFIYSLFSILISSSRCRKIIFWKWKTEMCQKPHIVQTILYCCCIYYK